MSTKIVSTASAPLNGEISKKDLKKIHSDFMKYVMLESTDKRRLKKAAGFYIDIAILKTFIQQAEEAGPAYTKLLLQFGVTLPGQKTCSKPFKDISNELTVTFLMANKAGKVKDSVNDGVLTAGFKASQSFIPKKSGARSPMELAANLTCCGAPIPPTKKGD